MYTQLVKIAEYGLKGDTQAVESFLAHFVKNHNRENKTQAKLARKFQALLNGEKGKEVVLD